MKKERTLVLIKPDGIQRTLVGEIIKRLERVGLKLTAIKMIVPNDDFIEKHYTLDPEWRRITGEKTIKSYLDKGLKPPYSDPYKVTEIILNNMKKFMTSGPVIAMVWQGVHSVKLTRKLVGGTEPFTSDIGTIRGDFVLDSYELSDTDGRAIRNLVHASGSIDDSEKEINLWFKPEEIINYRLISERILYDVNLDGMLE